MSDAIDAHNAPAIIDAMMATITPNGAATNAASAPMMNCPSPPMFHTPARNATTTARPVRSSGTVFSSVPSIANVDPIDPAIRMRTRSK